MPAVTSHDSPAPAQQQLRGSLKAAFTHLFELIILQLGEVVGQKLGCYHPACTSARSCQQLGAGLQRERESREGGEGRLVRSLLSPHADPSLSWSGGRGRPGAEHRGEARLKGERKKNPVETGVQQRSCLLVCDRHTLTTTHTQHTTHTHTSTHTHTEAGFDCVSSL